MKKNYTQDTLSQFFEDFKNLPSSYKIEQVHQLLNNPDAKATHKVNFHVKHLKLIIMTSAFIMGVTTVMLWLSPKETTNDGVTTEKHPIHIEYATQNENEKAQLNSQETNHVVKNHESKSPNLIDGDTKPIISDEYNLNTISAMAKDSIYNSVPEKYCSWPLDTVLDKKSLYVYLSNTELKKLGVLLNGNTLYYENKVPGEKGRTTGYKYNWDGPNDLVTNHQFVLEYITDNTCTTYRWKHPFYQMVDTLVPVIIKIGDKDKILWFTPHTCFFETLPERYAHLGNTFENLICVKKQNPSHRFVNHWNETQNVVLDRINSLSVSNESLEKIGFELFEDSISLVHPEFNMHFNMDKWGDHVGVYTRDTPYPPNPLPVIITDEKGLEQFYFGHGKQNAFDISMFDILVPVKIPLNELISTYDYYLIFWFYPTDEFIDALPEEIKYDLKSERNDILNNSVNSEKSCTYFEVCKSTLTIDDLNVYPNPANSNVTIEFSLPQETSGSISLVNISGVQIKSLVSQRNLNSGLNSYEANLSDVSPGVYLIIIITPDGFKTQRIIVSR